jgi:hypothetical protein
MNLHLLLSIVYHCVLQVSCFRGALLFGKGDSDRTQSSTQTQPKHCLAGTAVFNRQARRPELLWPMLLGDSSQAALRVPILCREGGLPK